MAKKGKKKTVASKVVGLKGLGPDKEKAVSEVLDQAREAFGDNADMMKQVESLVHTALESNQDDKKIIKLMNKIIPKFPQQLLDQEIATIILNVLNVYSINGKKMLHILGMVIAARLEDDERGTLCEQYNIVFSKKLGCLSVAPLDDEGVVKAIHAGMQAELERVLSKAKDDDRENVQESWDRSFESFKRLVKMKFGKTLDEILSPTVIH